MADFLTIAIDAMGGDHGPASAIPGAALVLSEKPTVRFLIFGRSAEIEKYMADYPNLRAASTVYHTDHVVANDEKPAVALRQGKESSMRKAIEAVADGRAACVVSSGNTGALMAMAKVVLKTLPGIHRPAIASVFPTTHDEIVMLDLGANITCDPEMMVQFAVLGSVYARVVRGVDRPTVGILNVGSEEMKGHDELRQAATILSSIKFPGKFYGFVEGTDITAGTTDVIVTDGFTGNVAIKVAEGVAKLMGTFTRQAFSSSIFAMMGAVLVHGGMKRLKKRLDPRAYNGGMFLGLNGVCVKSHGGSDHIGFANAVSRAAVLAENKFNEKVAAEIEIVMSQESFLNSVTSEVA